MKILFLAPWFRTLAVGWAEGLRGRGIDVRVVTTAQHFDPPAVREHDVVFMHRWRMPAGVVEMVRAGRELRAWNPDVVIVDPVRDPRYVALAQLGRQQVVVTHDARPHDSAHRNPLLRRLTTSIHLRRADAEVVFSEYVREVIGDRGHPVVVLPLMSEMREDLTPSFVGPEGRKDFLVIGRLSPYKNVGIIVDAFEQHRRSAAYRGDRLVVIGGGDPGCHLPGSVEWVDERFRFADIAPRLAAAKASICMYSAGSQSGVQVWAMQCGTPSLVSEVGALGEYLPEGDTVIRHDDAAALARAFDRLADPVAATEQGRRHRLEYERHLTASHAVNSWEHLLIRMAAGSPLEEGRRG